MAKPASTAAANYSEPDFQKYVEKEPTATQEHFLKWVLDKTGITFPTKKEESAFKAGIVIGTSLRGLHQASPENQTRLAEQRAASLAAREAEEDKPAPTAKAAAVPAKKAAAKATAAPVETAPPVKRAAAKKAAARRPTGTTSKDQPAPF